MPPVPTTSPVALERVGATGWVAPDQQWSGGWLLRAAGGFTGRANSVLPLGEPDRPVPQAVTDAQRWYAERGLPCRFSLFGPVGSPVAGHPLGGVLLERGYRPAGGALVLTGDTVSLADSAAPDVTVTESVSLTDAWLATFREQRPDHDDHVVRRVLSGSPEQVFLSVVSGGRTVAVARVSVDAVSLADGWAGVTAVWVEPGRRREGLARALMRSAGTVALARGVRSAYLQVAPTNAAALAVYDRLGFAAHHEYAYLVEFGSSRR